MDKTKGRKPTFKSQTTIAPKTTDEDFKSSVEWTEEQSNRILVVHLPGFTREEIRVQLDNARKLLIKGIKQASDKYVSVDLSFDVPDDTISEKISGRFEDERLTLIMPKRVVKRQEATEKEKAISEDKGKEPIQNEKPNNAEVTKEEEATQKEAPKAQQNEPESKEDSKQETIRNLISRAEGEKKGDGPICEEKSAREEEKKDEPVEKLEGVEEKKKEDPLQAMLNAVERGKEEANIQKMKSRMKEICADKPKEIIKRVAAWNAGDSYGSLDGILEKMNRNRKVIAIAVAAFSIGFYVSHKFRTRGK